MSQLTTTEMKALNLKEYKNFELIEVPIPDLDENEVLTNGRGADIAMEVVGITPTINLAIGMLRKGGALVCVGNIAQKIEFPLQAVVTRELSIYGSCSIKNEYPQAIEYISSGQIQVDPMISAVAPLSDGAHWFSKLHENKEDLLKIILEPSN